MKGQVTHTQYLLPLRALLEAIKQIGTFCLQTDLPTFLVANSNSSLLGDLSLSHVTPQRMKDFWRTRTENDDGDDDNDDNDDDDDDDWTRTRTEVF